MGSGCTRCSNSEVRRTNQFQKIKLLEQNVISLQFEIAQDWIKVIELLQNPNNESISNQNTQFMSTMNQTH